MTAGTGIPCSSTVYERRLCREVEVPQIVVHQLLVPHELAGRRIECEQRVGETIAAQARTAVEVGAGRAGRDIHQTVVRIDRHDAPCVGGARPRCLGKIPVRCGGMRRGVRNRIEAPAQRSGVGIEGAHDPPLYVSRPVVADRRADDEHVTQNGRG